MDLSSIVNIIYPVHSINLDFHIKKINVTIQKIDISYLDIFKLVLVDFLIYNR